MGRLAHLISEALRWANDRRDVFQEDYNALVRLIVNASGRFAMRLLACCAMPDRSSLASLAWCFLSSKHMATRACHPGMLACYPADKVSYAVRDGIGRGQAVGCVADRRHGSPAERLCAFGRT
jgi:hypothetical protein